MCCHSEHDHAALVFGGHLCGSEPARDGVCTFDNDAAGRLPSRASLAPTVLVVCAAFMHGADHCGSQPAGDGICTFDIDVAGRLPLRASRIVAPPLPQGSAGGRSIYVRRRSLWEPGLPAMASAHSTLMWQGDCHRGQVRSHRVVLVDAAFMYGADHCGSQPAGDGVCTFDNDAAGRLPSRASLAHRVLVVYATFLYGSHLCGSRACPRWRSDKHRMMSDVGSRLRRLAPLPTTTSESAGLCGLDASGSLISVTAHQ